ncbi:2Fe-2S iron-sulfur cluster binding domain-containing protein [Amphritea atlantica]|uniref:2Fe-2S iron-sulfur cluster binding domain-containing protein n=1 Tax=Amphritea atlantica TaxID=355243 RepID=A0ABY5GZN7_9GAMM|nr:2Fe-2S iron-sulfur cluster binding domain-containing protein [Amphritea atlantica]
MDILVKPINKAISVSSNSTLLDAFITNEVPISYSCMSGRCGTCRCKVVEGEVTGPSAADGRLARQGQFVLACQSHIESDCIIEIPEPDEIIIYPTKTLKATVTHYESLSFDVRRLRLKTNKPFDYAPGQFVNLTFWREDGTRSYSMAGVRKDNELEFHIRVVPDGRVTSRLDETLKVGSSVKLNGPLGASYLRTTHEGPMLCVATGTGLAPVLSIIRGALESGMPNPIHLLFGARTQADLYGIDLLEQLSSGYENFEYTLTLDHTTESKGYFRGLVTDAITELFPDLRDWRIYLAGAPAMVEAASIACTLRQANIEHIYADAFYPSGV